MVCIRRKMVVKDELIKLGLHYTEVELGQADIIEDITDELREKIKVAFLRSGLELMDDKKSILIQKIKNIIVELVHYSEPLSVNLSVYLSQHLQHDYRTFLRGSGLDHREIFYRPIKLKRFKNKRRPVLDEIE